MDNVRSVLGPMLHSASQTSRRYIPTLDGWRAIAIILVLFCHDRVRQFGPLSTSWLNQNGQWGVDIFFALSGILICSLLLEEEQQTGAISLRQFYVRRAFRILPAALVYLLSVGLLSLGGVIEVHGIDWLGALFFFRNYLPDSPSHWYVSHFWSLSVEEHFYLLLPGFLVLCTRFRAGLLLLAGIATVLGRVAARGHLEVAFTDFRLGTLIIAAAFAVALRRPDVQRWVARCFFPVPLIALAAALIGFRRFTFTVVPFVLAAMVVSTTRREKSLFSRLLEWAPLRFIGKRSYSIYLWQQLFMTARYGPRIPDIPLQHWPVSVLFSFAMGCVSYSLIEQPGIRLGRKLLSRASRAAEPLSEVLPAPGPITADPRVDAVLQKSNFHGAGKLT